MFIDITSKSTNNIFSLKHIVLVIKQQKDLTPYIQPIEMSSPLPTI